jgi:hypothetical protein
VRSGAHWSDVTSAITKKITHEVGDLKVFSEKPAIGSFVLNRPCGDVPAALCGQLVRDRSVK